MSRASGPESEDGARLWNLAAAEVHWDNDVPVLGNNANHISPLGCCFKVKTNSLLYIKFLYCFNEGPWIPARCGLHFHLKKTQQQKETPRMRINASES